MTNLTVRPAVAADAPAMGQLGALLVSAHHEWDAERFMAPRPQAHVGYARFLESQIEEPDALVLVAECDQRVVGYVYAAMQPLDWASLRDACGYIHDVVVEPSVRRSGVGRALLTVAFEWFRQRGAPRVVLMSAERNAPAQRLFEEMGFRRTMVELTREL